MRAVVIAGNSVRFLREAEEAKKYLEQVKSAQVQLIKTAYLSTTDFWEIYQTQLQWADSSPIILIWFIGHGSGAGWLLNEEGTASYKRLAEILNIQTSKPVIVINDCCKAGAIKCRITEFADLANRCGAVLACSETGTTKGGMSPRIVRSWTEGRLHKARTVERCVTKISPKPLPARVRLADCIRHKWSVLLNWINPEKWDAIFEGTMSLGYQEELVKQTIVYPEEVWNNPLQHLFVAEEPEQDS